jgi:hypothetical protein
MTKKYQAPLQIVYIFLGRNIALIYNVFRTFRIVIQMSHRQKILVVDDEYDNAFVLKSGLS